MRGSDRGSPRRIISGLWSWNKKCASVAFIDEHKERFGVEPICRVLSQAGWQVAPSTYYAAKNRQRRPSARARRDEALKQEIIRVWTDKRQGRRLYGARRSGGSCAARASAWPAARSNGLMGDVGIAGVCPPTTPPRTTEPGAAADQPDDLLGRDFTACAPNRRWVADITYVDTASGWFYTAFITDLYAKVIVGWQVSDHLRTDLALDALEMAIWGRRDRIDGRLAHHSDRGVQYTSISYTQRLEELECGTVVHRRSRGERAGITAVVRGPAGRWLPWCWVSLVSPTSRGGLVGRIRRTVPASTRSCFTRPGRHRPSRAAGVRSLPGAAGMSAVRDRERRVVRRVGWPVGRPAPSAASPRPTPASRRGEAGWVSGC